jgi:hypothetical protein
MNSAIWPNSITRRLFGVRWLKLYRIIYHCEENCEKSGPRLVKLKRIKKAALAAFLILSLESYLLAPKP